MASIRMFANALQGVESDLLQTAHDVKCHILAGNTVSS